MMPSFTLDNLFAWTAQIFVVGLIGMLLLKAFRLHHPRFQLNYCYLLLTLCLTLPLIQPLKPGAADASAAAQSGPTDAWILSSVVAQRFGWMPALIAWIILAGILTKLGLFVAGIVRIRQYRKSAIALHFPKESMLSVCKLLKRDVEVGVSANDVGPVAFGWIRPMVLLPASFLSLDEEEQRAILCHELLHVVRRDWLATVCEEVIGACFWFHPAVWWMLSQTNLAREQLIDAEVVRLTGAQDSYIHALLAIACGGNETLAPAPLFLRRRHLTARMRTLIEMRRASITRLALSGASIATAVVCAALLALNAFPLLASATFHPTAFNNSMLPSATPEVFTIEDDVTPPKITNYVTPEYSDTAKQANIEGMVVLEAIIQVDGAVGDIAVKRSLNPDLDHNAVYALKQWRFLPGLRHGTPVAVKVFIEMNFQLKASR